MLVQEQFVAIKAPPATVERYLTDPQLLAEWRSPLVVFDPIEGDLMTLGSKHKLRLKSLALAGATYTVVERDSGHILLKMEGLWQGQELWRWFADGDRTIVQHRVEYEVTDPSLRVFVAGIGQLFVSLDMRIELDRLRMILEGRSQPATAQSR